MPGLPGQLKTRKGPIIAASRIARARKNAAASMPNQPICSLTSNTIILTLSAKHFEGEK